MSSGLTRQHDPAQIVMTVGTRTVSGYAKGSFVEIDRYEDAVKTDVGSDGEVTLIISQNKSGYFKFTLQQSSPLNDYFTALKIAMENRQTGVAVVPITVKDVNGTSLAQCVQAWVKKTAKMEFQDVAGNREWTFDTGYLDNQPGGQAAI